MGPVAVGITVGAAWIIGPTKAAINISQMNKSEATRHGEKVYAVDGIRLP